MSLLERPHFTNGTLLMPLHQPEATAPYASLLEELLLALIGHDGNVFVRDDAYRLETEELHCSRSRGVATLA